MNNSEQGNISCCMSPILNKWDGKIVYNRTIKVIDKVYWRKSKTQSAIISTSFNVFQHLVLPQQSIFPPFLCGAEATVQRRPVYFFSSQFTSRSTDNTQILKRFPITNCSGFIQPVINLFTRSRRRNSFRLESRNVSWVRELFILRTLSVARTTERRFAIQH
jgi:hypothetical protein